MIRLGAHPRTDSRPPAALVVESRSSRPYAQPQARSRPPSRGSPRRAGQRCSRVSPRIRLHRPSRCRRQANRTVPGRFRCSPRPRRRSEPCRQRECRLGAANSRVVGPPYRSGTRQPPQGPSGPGRSALAWAPSPIRRSSGRSPIGPKHPRPPRCRLSLDPPLRPPPVTARAPGRRPPSPASGRPGHLRPQTPMPQTPGARHPSTGVLRPPRVASLLRLRLTAVSPLLRRLPTTVPTAQHLGRTSQLIADSRQARTRLRHLRRHLVARGRVCCRQLARLRPRPQAPPSPRRSPARKSCRPTPNRSPEWRDGRGRPG